MTCASAGERRGAAPRGAKLLETPSGAALIAAFRPVRRRPAAGSPFARRGKQDGRAVVADNNGDRWELPEALRDHAVDARWIRGEAGRSRGC
jgi:hypothetical protein